ncbi:hypothetical protein N7519_004502 [Penicillium mononematosum]|uniref:uncharacterized protein n=1 Tax=Penicillium mononematosum TaxID=268346 RepID=UPI0025467484|nr:uncharacterized protein N7519_004502 [Penicillium mononematosum]KAJ6189594.1 hypothetical protein N7519_004502 [Penicillium mononematosum]
MEREISRLLRRAEEAEKLAEEAEKRLEEAKKRNAEAKKREEEAQRQLSRERLESRQILQLVRKTTLPEFLDACHVHLFLGLAIQPDPNSSTKGKPANADDKYRPAKIREWMGFPQEQAAIWADLMGVDFVTQRHFLSLLMLKEYGREVPQRMSGSELDLGYFERLTIESRLADIIRQLYTSPQIRRVFHLKGDVTFENHANTLTDGSMVDKMKSMSLEPKQQELQELQEQPRRSGRLAAKQSDKSQLPPSSPPDAESQGPVKRKQPKPRGDQICVYNKAPEERVPVFIVEYKAPHKLTLAHILAGLSDMEVDQVVHYQEDETPEVICRRVVAAVITQAFSHMITAGLEFGYVCTGEAFIFLRVPRDDPSTVYYYLSVPKEDVGDTTGWTGDPSDDNRLHLTAIGQVLAFTLRALQTPRRGMRWSEWAEDRLVKWEMIFDHVLGELSNVEVPSSEYKPPRTSTTFGHLSLVKTRSKSTAATFASCTPLEALSSSESGDSPDGPNSHTPSRRPWGPRADHSALPPSSAATKSRGGRGDSSSKGKSRQYCTQQCLLGLVTRGSLDQECPNVLDHGVDRHPISKATLIRLLDRQFFGQDLGPDVEDVEMGCESLHIHGTRGALFKVTLLSHGYTFVGKGVPIEFFEHIQHEQRMYSRLRPLQGVHVPVVLGGLTLRRSISYDGIVEIVHFMLMGYAGRTLAERHEIEPDQLIRLAEVSLHAIHGLGVLHSDPIAGNMVYNEDSGRVMFIDFERAEFQKRRPALESLSPNQKCKQATDACGKNPNKRDNFELETRRMRHAMLW